MISQRHDQSLKNTVCALLIVMVIVVLLDVLQFSLEKPVEIRLPMTMYEQCQIWNKWSGGSCPGDFQARVWR